MRAILSAPGSRGDVNPMIAIGRQLKKIGFEVVISVAEPYAALARQAGLSVESVISTERFSEAIGNANVWRPIQGPLQIFHVMVRDFLESHERVIQRHMIPGQTVLVAHPLDLVSRVIREANPSVPLVGVHLQPVILRTFRQPPRLSPWWFEPRGPQWLIKACYACIDLGVIDALLRNAINRIRRRHGLTHRVRRIMDRWWLSPDATMALYPERFAPGTVGFAPGLVHCGFPLEDISGKEFETPANRPIVFTSGTAHRHCRKFFELAVQVCGQLERPGLLLSSYPENFPTQLPTGMESRDYFSLRRLLPHCSAIVHHGGVGTTSQALAAGIPQVIRPLAFDQFDNAERIERLGCGRWLKRDAQLLGTLQEILPDPNQRVQRPTSYHAKSLEDFSDEVRGVNGAEVAAQRIHHLTKSFFPLS